MAKTNQFDSEALSIGMGKSWQWIDNQQNEGIPNENMYGHLFLTQALRMSTV